MVTVSNEVEFLIALIWQNIYLTSLVIKKKKKRIGTRECRRISCYSILS